MKIETFYFLVPFPDLMKFYYKYIFLIFKIRFDIPHDRVNITICYDRVLGLIFLCV